MQESDSIRPEITGLFETIREQAIKYNDAFSDLNKYSQIYQNQIKSVNDFLDSMDNTFKNEIDKLHQETGKSIEMLKIEHKKTQEKYAELSELKILQDSYKETIEIINELKINFQTELETQVVLNKDLEKNIFEYRKKADDEITTIVNESQNVLVLAASNESQKIEDRITLRMKQIENRIQKVEQIVWDLNTRFVSDTKNLYRDFDTLKSAFSSIGFLADEQIKHIKEQYDSNQNKINTRLSHFQDTIILLEDKIKRLTTISSMEEEKNDSENMPAAPVVHFNPKDTKKSLTQLHDEQLKLGEQVESVSTKNTLTLVASIFAVILGLAAILLNLFN